MKYIDSEKLIAELERMREIANKAFITDHAIDVFYGREQAINHLFEFITSLQLEQESIAERFARIIRGNLTGIDKEVQQKFEQLYFEVTGNKMYGGYND